MDPALALALLISSLNLVTGANDPSTFLDFGDDFIFGLAWDSFQFEGSPPLDKNNNTASKTQRWCEWALNGGQDTPYMEICGDVVAGGWTHMENDVSLLRSMQMKHVNGQIR